MDWEDFNEQRFPEYLFTKKILTDINCPKCNRKIYMRTDKVLTTYPAQYQYECDCGWVGYSFKRSGPQCSID
jgi:predicted RNA-binding Zn-ribbon protein involved in translation (DUF1610 family)